MDDIPVEFIDRVIQAAAMPATCALRTLPDCTLWTRVADNFHKRFFTLVVYMRKEKLYNMRIVPVNRDCGCSPEAEWKPTQKFPKCIENNMKYLREIQIIYDAEDRCHVAVTSRFFPLLKVLMKNSKAEVVPAEDFEREQLFVEKLLRTHEGDLKGESEQLYAAMKHLLTCAFASGQVVEIFYRHKNEDRHEFIKQLFNRRDRQYKMYVQDSASMNGFRAVLAQLFIEWMSSDNPIYGKYMVSGGDLLCVYEEVKSNDDWIQLTKLPPHLAPYLNDIRYPLFHKYAVKCVYVRPHPMVPNRKLYIVLGVYEEQQEQYRNLQKHYPGNYPELMPFKFAMHECETAFMFYD